ncbi:MAG TPA: redoxin domain-containing protein, partial [Polyangiaceae bacterium]|nr:redoxin domain-containing protein [Polyangiaceae bacterium]
KYGLPFTLLSDPEKSLANAYGVWGMKQNYGKEYMGIIRSTFLVGADGLIKKSYRGVKVDGHVDAILQDAQALL